MKLLILTCILVASIIQITKAGMVGGWSPVEDLNSTSIRRIVDFATREISASSNAAYFMRPIEIVKAEKQVVSGMNYKITMKIGATECKKNKNHNVDLDDCPLLNCGRVEKCDITVWDKPWEDNATKLTSHSCSTEPKNC